MREQIVEILLDTYGMSGANINEKCADQILAIVNKPIEVRLKCEKCGGKGYGDVMTCSYPKGTKPDCIGCKDCPPCTCDKGERAYHVMWEWEGDAPIPEPLHIRSEGMKENHCGNEGAPSPRFEYSRPLTPTDLIDPDVAWTYSWFHHCSGFRDGMQKALPNNKGTLRLQEAP
jgi:hypothetical protein